MNGDVELLIAHGSTAADLVQEMRHTLLFILVVGAIIALFCTRYFLVGKTGEENNCEKCSMRNDSAGACVAAEKSEHNAASPDNIVEGKSTVKVSIRHNLQHVFGAGDACT